MREKLFWSLCNFVNVRTFCQMLGNRCAKLRDFHLKVVPGPHWQHAHLHSHGSSSIQLKGQLDPAGSWLYSMTGDSAQRFGHICCDPSAAWRGWGSGWLWLAWLRGLLRPRHCETLGGHPCKCTCPLPQHLHSVKRSKVLQSDGFQDPNHEIW